MGYETKSFVSGEPIKSLNEVMEQQFIFHFGSLVNIAVFQNWQARFLKNKIDSGNIFKAIRKDELDTLEQRLTFEQLRSRKGKTVYWETQDKRNSGYMKVENVYTALFDGKRTELVSDENLGYEFKYLNFYDKKPKGE